MKMDIHFFKKSNLKSISIIILLSIMMMLPQIYDQSVIFGADSIFHFNRFYDTAMQIKTGHYSYFMSLFGFNQSGRIVNALYGPMFAYLNGLLLLISGSWFKYQVLSGILINIVSGIGFYKLARKLGSHNEIAIGIAFLYMNTYWITSWSHSQQFTSFGAALMPYVAMQAVGMISKRQPKINILALAIVMAIVIQTHMLSAVFAVCLLIPFALVGFYLTSEKYLFMRNGVASVLLTLCLTGNVWMGFLDVSSNNKLIQPHPQTDLLSLSTNLSLDGGDSFGKLGILSSFLFITQIVLVLQKTSLISFENKLITIIGTLFLIISSSLIPWNIIGDSIPALDSFLQFPFRLVVISNILLLLSISLTLSQIELVKNFQTVNLPIAIVSVLSIVFFTLNFQGLSGISKSWNGDYVLSNRININFKKTDPAVIRSAFRDDNLGKPFTILQKSTPDYLPAHKDSKLWDDNNFHPYNENIKATFFNPLKVTKSIDSHNQLILKWQGNSKKVVTLPVYKYADSKMSLNHRALDNSKVQTTVVGAVRVKQVKGKNTFKIGYQPSRTFRYMSGLTVISWFTLIGFGAIKLFKHIRFLLTKNMVLK